MSKFRECRYGFIALGIGIAEVTLIWGSLGVVYAMGIWGNAPKWLADIFAIMYLAGVAALAVAALGLRRDSWRGWASLALLLGALNLVVCGIPIAGLR